LADKTTSTIKFSLANPLPRTLKQPSQTFEEKEKDVLLKIVLQNYEDREQMVMIENNNLRKLLFRIYNTVQQCISHLNEEGKQMKIVENGEIDSKGTQLYLEADNMRDIPAARFQLPFDSFCHSIDDAIVAGCDAICKLTQSTNKCQIDVLADQISELNFKNGSNI
jgi:hypothetical protein